MSKAISSARTFAAMAVIAAIGDGKLTEAEVTEGAERAVALRDAFAAEILTQGVTDQDTIDLGKRLLNPALRTKGEIGKAAKFALRCASKTLAAIDAIDATPAAPAGSTDIV